MPQEIERKFLIKNEDYKQEAISSDRICQGYICRKEGTVRVRIRKEKGYLTIKGASKDGVSRYEWEKEIPLNEAEELMELCHDGIIEKVRWIVPFKGHIFEVDEFHGLNEGLTVAEIELKAVEEKFEKPSWLSEEVTGNRLYHNSHLIDLPYSKWTK